MRRRFLIRSALLDLLSLAAAMAGASLLVFGTALPWHAQPDIWPLLGYLTVSALVASWATARTLAQTVPRPSYGRAITIATGAVALTALGIVLTRPYWSRPFLGVTAVAWLGLMLAHRAVSRRRPWTEPLVVITSEKQLVDDLRFAPHADIRQVLDPQGDAPSEPLPAGVTLALDLRAVLSDPMARFVSSSNLAGSPIRSLANVYEEHTGRLPIVHLAEGWELSTPVQRSAWYAAVKRVLDTVLVLVLAPIWVPLAALIWLAVRLDSSGPAIFRQTRIGRDGRPFTLYKFRTMVQDAEADGPRFATPNDPRLTRVGKVLRRFRADEIPQLWNVLKGDLSLVGPRPEQPAFVEMFERSIPFYRYRHLIRPGVTGWAQVNYGYADDEADTVDKLTYDLYYVKHMSPALDLHVLGRSIWTILSGFGAQ